MNSPVALVITAPTIGFGEVLPRPARAHSMARAIAASALNTWFIFNTLDRDLVMHLGGGKSGGSRRTKPLKQS